MENSLKSITTSMDRMAFGVLDLSAATGLSPGFVRKQEKLRKLIGARMGRRLIFTRQAVEDWLRAAE